MEVLEISGGVITSDTLRRRMFFDLILRLIVECDIMQYILYYFNYHGADDGMGIFGMRSYNNKVVPPTPIKMNTTYFVFNKKKIQYNTIQYNTIQNLRGCHMPSFTQSQFRYTLTRRTTYPEGDLQSSSVIK